MAARTYLKVVTGILLAAAFAAATAVILVPRLLDLETHRPQILAMAEKALNRRVSYESASFSWHLVPTFVFHHITVAGKSGDDASLKAGRLTFKLALLPLLNKEVRLREVIVDRPVIALDRNRAGVFNVDDLFTGKPSEFKIHLKAVRITNGTVHFTDRSIDPEGFSASLENLGLYASGLARGETSDFRLSATIPDKDGNTALSISGTARIPAQQESMKDAQLDVTLAARNLDTGRFWPYYGRYLPFERVRGRLDIEGVFKGKPGEFTTKGRLGIRDLRFNYPEVFPATLTPRDVRLAYEVELTPRDLAVKKLDLTVDGLRITGSCTLGDIHSRDPRITARAVTSTFRLEEFRRYIPYGIIARGTADFIEQHVNGGIYRLDEGKLDGRASQLLHMGREGNHNVLLIRGRVERGLVTFGPSVPAFNAIEGTLELTGRDFFLRRMTGNFGGSPFTMEGKISDYSLDTPARYPFTMTITPAAAEVAWLFRQEKQAAMAFSGRSTLNLTGAGSADDYRLAGSWDLSGADYRYRHLVHKPAGIANRLRFSARLGDSEAQLEDVRYELPPLDVTAGATYRYHDQASLTFSVDTNRFMVDPLIPIVPGMRKYHPSGSLQAHISGSGNPADRHDVRLKGDLALEGFSVRPLAQIKPLRNLTGTIHLTETSLNTEGLNGSVGNTHFMLRGRVAGYDKQTADLVFSSPELHPEDFGFHSPGEAPVVKNLSGSVSLKDRDLTISSLSGEIARSTFAVTGEVPDIERPEITLRVDFPYLRVEDMEPFTRLKRAGEGKEQPEGIILDTQVTSTAGSFRGVPFEHLDTELSLEKDRLAIQALSIGLFGGTVSGYGTADFSANGGPVYQAAYRLDRVDTDRLLHAAGTKPYLTGLLTAEGELTARGKTREELGKAINASARLHLQGGELIAAPPSEGSKGRLIPFSVLDATLSLQQKNLTIRQLNAGMFGGTVSGNGQVDFGADGGPVYQAHYRLKKCDTAQLLRAAGTKEYIRGTLAAEGELTARGSGWEQLRNTGRVLAEIDLSDGIIRFSTNDDGQGGTGRASFKSLHSYLFFSKNVLGIQSTRIDAFGGVITGEGEADFGIPDGPAYQLDCHVAAVDATEFFNLFRVTKELSGRLTLQAELMARGDTAAALEKTLQGSVGMHLEKGVINKYRILSRVFSILNVSQLLDFQLPDMVSTGMPYNRIEVNFSLRDGIASTSDLTIDSPSVDMTAVGTSDLVKKEVDLKIGVQPLQTVGRIVSRIPIIGWIMTGGKKRLLVLYFEAKGPWDDPKVSSVTVTSLSRGVYNIFKRAFDLPETLITEPGKVILGN